MGILSSMKITSTRLEIESEFFHHNKKMMRRFARDNWENRNFQEKFSENWTFFKSLNESKTENKFDFANVYLS